MAQAVQKQLEEANTRSKSLDTSYVNEFENRVKTESELLREPLKERLTVVTSMPKSKRNNALLL
jgi:hypothetical protein